MIGKKQILKHFINLQSNNNRLKEPMKFKIKNLRYGGIHLYEKLDYELIKLGDIYLMKENRKNKSFYEQNKGRFDYHGIENALCGKDSDKYRKIYFTPKRILVIQMI